MNRLNEQQRRWYAAWKPSDTALEVSGAWPKSQGWMRRPSAGGGRNWPKSERAGLPTGCVFPGPVGPWLKKQPGVEVALKTLVEDEVAGTPEGKPCWVQRSLGSL